MYVVVANDCCSLVFYMTQYIIHHYTVNGFIMIWIFRRKYHSNNTWSIYIVYGGHFKKMAAIVLQMAF